MPELSDVLLAALDSDEITPLTFEAVELARFYAEVEIDDDD